MVGGGAGRLAGSVLTADGTPLSVQAARETRQDVEPAGGAVLRGVVRATGGLRVEDTRVTLLDAAGHAVDTLTTGPDGSFRFVDLSAGEYTVATAGYPPVATVLQVPGESVRRLGQERDRRRDLRRTGPLASRISLAHAARGAYGVAA